MAPVEADVCDFTVYPVFCMAQMFSNHIARSLEGHVGAPNQISVGFDGGDTTIPVLPFGALVTCVITGIMLRALLGRPRFMPKSLAGPVARASIFVAAIASLAAVVKSGSTAMKEADVNQGPNFLPVNKLVTTGPYAVSRNPMYSCAFILVPAAGVLADSLYMVAATSMLPVYLHLFVIPAEEALNRKLFGKEFDAYAAKVPRWLF